MIRRAREAQERTVFEKAQRKVAEADFFVRSLRGEQNPDAVEFLFNALLNAGKNVVNALHADIYFREEQTQKPAMVYQLCLSVLRFFNSLPASLTAWCAKRATKQVKKRAQRGFKRYFKDWRRTLTPDDVDLFDVLQELRNIEVHAESSASKHVPKVEERRQLRPVPSDPHARAVYASYVAMGMMSGYEIVGETTYDFQVDREMSADAAARFERFAKNKVKATVEIGEMYAKLLKSLVEYFVAHYS